MRTETALKLNQVKLATFEDASLATLTTAVNAWLAAELETILVQVEFQPGGAGFTAAVWYTRG